MAGRIPKLDGRKALTGAQSLRADGITKAELAGLKRPSTLNRHGRFCWENALASLVPKGHLALIDIPALEMMCHNYQRWVGLELKIARLEKEEAGTGDVAVTPNGHHQQSVWRNMANQAQLAYRMMAKEMGATPVARIRTAGTAQGDLFDFLGAGGSSERDDSPTNDDAVPSAVDPCDPFGPPPTIN